MSKRTLSVLLLVVVAVLAAACGSSATSTPTAKPPATATTAAQAATAEVTAASTSEATKEATSEVTAEATKEATTEVTAESTSALSSAAEATKAATAEVTAEMTTEATMEATMEATAEMTAEATEAVAVVPSSTPTTAPTATKEATATTAPTATKEATATTEATVETAAEATMEATMEMTSEATMEATMEMTAEMTAEATVAATATLKPTLVPTAEATTEATMEATSEATSEATQSASAGGLIPVRLQLQWVAQSQFAGYYAAQAEGYYKDEGLDVTLLEGGPNIIPQTVVAGGGAEFGIAWVPKVLQSREQGADLVNIAQIFQRSGTLEIAFKDKGITSVSDLKGKNVGSWLDGDEDELFAALRAQSIDPDKDVTIVKQPFDMSLMLNGQIDAAEAMVYNEYAQVLEQVNPATGKLYTPDDIDVINFNDVGTAMLQDNIFSLGSWLDGTTNGVKNTDIAVKFIRASIKGWIYARDHFDDTVSIVLKNGSTLGKSHQEWQLNEINKLIWPSPNGIGVMDPALWNQTVQEAIAGKIITKDPGSAAYRTDLAQQAVDSLAAEGVDVKGADYKPQTITLTPGGN